MSEMNRRGFLQRCGAMIGGLSVVRYFKPKRQAGYAQPEKTFHADASHWPSVSGSWPLVAPPVYMALFRQGKEIRARGYARQRLEFQGLSSRPGTYCVRSNAPNFGLLRCRWSDLNQYKVFNKAKGGKVLMYGSMELCDAPFPDAFLTLSPIEISFD